MLPAVNHTACENSHCIHKDYAKESSKFLQDWPSSSVAFSEEQL